MYIAYPVCLLAEVDCLYHIGQFNQREGAIVEVGSWKGKSTIACRLVPQRYTKKRSTPSIRTRFSPKKYFEDTEAEFFANIKQAGIDSQVAPMIMTSEEAARGWNKPIRLLWIDGDHRHESTKLDFALWEPHVVEGGILAMHDTIKKKGPKRVLWEPCFARVAFKKLPLSTASLLLGLHRCIW